MKKQDILSPPRQPERARDFGILPVRGKRIVDAFLSTHHYLGSVQGWVLCLGAWSRTSLIGLCILGHPAARNEDQESTLEVTRLAFAPGAPKNSPSRILGAAKRAAKKLGYRRLIAYASSGQGHRGTVYLAAGFLLIGKIPGRAWTRKGRPRADRDTSPKRKFEAIL